MSGSDPLRKKRIQFTAATFLGRLFDPGSGGDVPGVLISVRFQEHIEGFLADLILERKKEQRAAPINDRTVLLVIVFGHRFANRDGLVIHAIPAILERSLEPLRVCLSIPVSVILPGDVLR